MRRVIILSAVRILEKPVFFYPMAKMIRPDLVPAFMEYGYRYCDPRQSFEGIDFGHAGNLTELK
jgi:SWI/SNF-related matrix-associated actin-dependent regulator 1 of chromatin subfamily A